MKLLLFFFCILPLSYGVASDNTVRPALLLANKYQIDIDLSDYWVSEKLDGVRAYWNGQVLMSRQGNTFHAPDWFIAPLPETPLDGELWLGRGRFEQLSGIVRQQSVKDSSWSGIKFMVFDVPVTGADNAKTFDQRLRQLKKIIGEIKATHVQMVRQFRVPTHQALMTKLDDVVSQGGEGLMLHSASSFYTGGRSDDLLKVKKYYDAEVIVIDYIPGKGKYKGFMGALLVEMANKKRFKIGTGFSDKERKFPPAIGSTITYKYFGLTGKGIPRFASFLRKRNEH